VSALLELQDRSYEHADAALKRSWPRERLMSGEALEAFLDERRYCVFATTTPRDRPQARPIAFLVVGDAFWFATVAGGRLRNVRRTPWVSVVISDGQADAHRVALVDGPVTIHETPPDGVLVAWEAKMESRPDWAAAWLELRPERLLSYSAS
jgi:nitroimidazol reductase NimA-like FMN-containing flavoprotein (pyridoxamine 5'-phosphate oxidase superfamily)